MKYVLFAFLSLSLVFSGFEKSGNSAWLKMADLELKNLCWNEKPGEIETRSNPILDHSSWDNLLKEFVAADGGVNYKGFLKNKEKLANYLDYLSENPPQNSWSSEKQLAYYINLYNAATVFLIVKNYPITSIKDIENPWQQDFIELGDKMISLETLEHSILRKMEEPRIHFAINCASISCPKLLNEAYTAKNLEDQLQEVTRSFINSEKNVISTHRVALSKIFDWYAKDFLNGDLISYINKYTKLKVDKDAKVDFMNYDWRLNDQ